MIIETVRITNKRMKANSDDDYCNGNSNKYENKNSQLKNNIVMI